MSQNQVSAAILTGGNSRRMGEPKALIRLQNEGMTLIETVVSTITPIADHVFLAGNRTWELPASLTYLDEVPDGGQGPADGIIAALESSRRDLCVVIACDMPFLNGELLTEMIDTATRTRTGVMARDSNGLHPLHAVYRTGDLPRIREVISGGQRSLSTIAFELSMHLIDLDEIDRPDRHRWSVFNANTPDEIDIARSRLE
jgi:molybdenum cofactor guanylyltransferase